MEKQEAIAALSNGCPVLDSAKIENQINIWMQDAWIQHLVSQALTPVLMDLQFRKMMRQCVLNEWTRRQGGRCEPAPDWEQTATDIRKELFENLITRNLNLLYKELYVVSPFLQNVKDLQEIG